MKNVNIGIDTQIGSTGETFTDNGTITFSGLSEQVEAENSVNWIVVYNLNGLASASETFRVYVAQNQGILRPQVYQV